MKSKEKLLGFRVENIHKKISEFLLTTFINEKSYNVFGPENYPNEPELPNFKFNHFYIVHTCYHIEYFSCILQFSSISGILTL